MDEMSDADRNSEVDEDENGIPNNDKGDEDGLNGHVHNGVMIDREDDVVTPEVVLTRGIVLTQADRLEGQSAGVLPGVHD